MRSMTILLIFLLVALTPLVWSWNGNTWGSMSRDEIVALANEMIDSTWTPANTIRIWQYDSTYSPYYYKGTQYTGIPYTQYNPQDNWADFIYWMSITSAGDKYYGNDCSGFASICWKLPSRMTTASFEDSIGSYWDSLGNIGSGQSVSLLKGDALNSKSNVHIILFNLNYAPKCSKSPSWDDDQVNDRY